MKSEISIIINPFSAFNINGHKLTGHLSTITKKEWHYQLSGGSIMRTYSPKIKPRA